LLWLRRAFPSTTLDKTCCYSIVDRRIRKGWLFVNGKSSNDWLSWMPAPAVAHGLTLLLPAGKLADRPGAL